MPGAGEVRTYSLLSNRFPDHTVALCAGGEQRQRRRLHHLLVRPRHCLRRAAGGVRPRQSIACSSLRSAPKLGLFPHRIEWGTSAALYFHGNKNASAFAACGGWRYRGEWRNARRARGRSRSAQPASKLSDAPPGIRRTTKTFRSSFNMNCHRFIPAAAARRVHGPGLLRFWPAHRCGRCRPWRPRPRRSSLSTHRREGHDARCVPAPERVLQARVIG